MARVPLILLVDDDQFARVFLRDALVEIGDARFVEASDGREALEAVRKEAPDLVLLDLLMPNKSGLEALPEIRKISSKTKIIVVSSMETPALVEQSKKDGAAGFIGKPFHPNEIVAMVRKVLGT